MLEEYLLRLAYGLLCEILFYQQGVILQGNIKVRSFMYVSDKNLFETMHSSTAIHFFLLLQRIVKDKRKNHSIFILLIDFYRNYFSLKNLSYIFLTIHFVTIIP